VTAVVRFWLSHLQELTTLAGEHVLLVALSTALAVAIGVPLGVFAVRRPQLASPLVAINLAESAKPALLEEMVTRAIEGERSLPAETLASRSVAGR